jgi:signal transduction histidine kinase
MSDQQIIRDLERQLAELDAIPTMDMHKRIDILNDLAWALADTDMKRAYALGEKAYTLASSPNNVDPPYQVGMAYSLRTQGYLNQRFGDYPLGLKQLFEAQEIFESLELYDGLSDVFDGIAGIYAQISNLPESLNYMYKQLDAAQRIGDKWRIANANNNLAHIYFETGDYERAEETLHHNLQIAAEIGYERVEFLSYGNLAETYLLAGEYEKALANALHGLRVSQEAGFELFEVYAFDLIGKSYLKMGDAGQAIQHLQRALALSRKAESKVTESLVLLSLGQAYRDGQKLDLALDHLQQSITIAQSIDAKSELFKAHLLLSEIYEQQGNFAQALHHFKQHHVFQELVFGEKADERLKVLQVVHDAETARQEAKIFKLRTVQLEQQVKNRTAELSETIELLQHEIKERERAEVEIQQMVDMLEQRVADRSRELAALYDMTSLFTEAYTLTDMLEPALSNICNSVGGSGIAVHILAADKSQLQLAAFLYISEGSQMQQVALDTDFSDWLNQADAPVMLVGNLEDHPILPLELLPPHYQTYLGTPLRVRKEVIGMLGVYREEKEPFSVKNVSLLITMGEQLGIIIQNHRLQEQSQRMARAIERQRLARELHDSVAQRIYSLNLFARAGQDALADGDFEDARLRLRQVEENARYTLREMRLLLYQLRPLALENQTLVDAMEERFALVERRLGIEAAIYGNIPPELPDAAEEDLYYIVTEALNNALKHAQATRVELRFDAVSDHLSIVIRDNGQGFDLTKPSPGLGLENMRSRATRINGSLDIETDIGEGTTIRISV